jgi:hypothetical protein
VKVPHICPRCNDNWIPNNDAPGQYPGAISRADNRTEICSDCGQAEAIQDWQDGGCTPVERWPIA